MFIYISDHNQSVAYHCREMVDIAKTRHDVRLCITHNSTQREKHIMMMHKTYLPVTCTVHNIKDEREVIEIYVSTYGSKGNQIKAMGGQTK